MFLFTIISYLLGESVAFIIPHSLLKINLDVTDDGGYLKVHQNNKERCYNLLNNLQLDENQSPFQNVMRISSEYFK